MISPKIFDGKTIDQLLEEYPVVRDVTSMKETVWLNDKKLPFEEAAAQCRLSFRCRSATGPFCGLFPCGFSGNRRGWWLDRITTS